MNVNPNTQLQIIIEGFKHHNEIIYLKKDKSFDVSDDDALLTSKNKKNTDLKIIKFILNNQNLSKDLLRELDIVLDTRVSQMLADLGSYTPLLFLSSYFNFGSSTPNATDIRNEIDRLEKIKEAVNQTLREEAMPIKEEVVAELDSSLDEERSSLSEDLSPPPTISIQKMVEPMMDSLLSIGSKFALPGMLTRNKMGEEVVSQFFSTDEILQKAESFAQFYVIPKSPFEKNPLNPEQLKKARELAARYPNNPIFQALIAKSMIPNGTRFDYDKDEWEALDSVNFELTQEHFQTLESLLNSPFFNQISDNMRETFQIDFRESLIAEVLSKSLAYIEGLEGRTILIPTFLNEDPEKPYQMIEYTIQLIKLGDNLPAYILEPRNAPKAAKPWLVVRGTDVVPFKQVRMASEEAVMADFISNKGISPHVILKSLSQPVREGQSLTDIFDRWEDGTVNLAGHSLGGYLVNDIAIRFANKVNHAYGFSAPAVGKKLGRKWRQLLESQQIKKEQIVNYDIEGDIVASSGRADGLVGLRIAITLASPPSKDDPLHSHLRHNLNIPFIAQEVDCESEDKFSRDLLEKILFLSRRIIKLVAYLSQQVPDWELNRDRYKSIDTKKH
jgi:hypothetical protein